MHQIDFLWNISLYRTNLDGIVDDEASEEDLAQRIRESKVAMDTRMLYRNAGTLARQERIRAEIAEEESKIKHFDKAEGARNSSFDDSGLMLGGNALKSTHIMLSQHRPHLDNKLELSSDLEYNDDEDGGRDKLSSPTKFSSRTIHSPSKSRVALMMAEGEKIDGNKQDRTPRREMKTRIHNEQSSIRSMKKRSQADLVDPSSSYMKKRSQADLVDPSFSYLEPSNDRETSALDAAQLRLENARLRAQLDFLQEQETAREEKLQNILLQVRDSGESQVALRNQVAEVRRSKLQQAREHLKVVGGLEAKIAECASHVEKHLAVNKQIMKRNKSLKLQLTSLEKLREEEVAQRERIEQKRTDEIEKMCLEQGEVQKTLRDLASELNARDEIIGQLRGRLEAATFESRTLSAGRDGLLKELKTGRAELAQLRARSVRYEEEQAELQSLRKCKDEIASLRPEMLGLRALQKQTKEQLDRERLRGLEAQAATERHAVERKNMAARVAEAEEKYREQASATRNFEVRCNSQQRQIESLVKELEKQHEFVSEYRGRVADLEHLASNIVTDMAASLRRIADGYDEEEEKEGDEENDGKGKERNPSSSSSSSSPKEAVLSAVPSVSNLPQSIQKYPQFEGAVGRLIAGVRLVASSTMLQITTASKDRKRAREARESEGRVSQRMELTKQQLHELKLDHVKEQTQFRESIRHLEREIVEVKAEAKAAAAQHKAEKRFLTESANEKFAEAVRKERDRAGKAEKEVMEIKEHLNNILSERSVEAKDLSLRVEELKGKNSLLSSNLAAAKHVASKMQTMKAKLDILIKHQAPMLLRARELIHQKNYLMRENRTQQTRLLSLAASAAPRDQVSKIVGAGSKRSNKKRHLTSLRSAVSAIMAAGRFLRNARMQNSGYKDSLGQMRNIFPGFMQHLRLLSIPANSPSYHHYDSSRLKSSGLHIPASSSSREIVRIISQENAYNMQDDLGVEAVRRAVDALKKENQNLQVQLRLAQREKATCATEAKRLQSQVHRLGKQLEESIIKNKELEELIGTLRNTQSNMVMKSEYNSCQAELGRLRSDQIRKEGEHNSLVQELKESLNREQNNLHSVIKARDAASKRYKEGEEQRKQLAGHTEAMAVEIKQLRLRLESRERTVKMLESGSSLLSTKLKGISTDLTTQRSLLEGARRENALLLARLQGLEVENRNQAEVNGALRERLQALERRGSDLMAKAENQQKRATAEAARGQHLLRTCAELREDVRNKAADLSRFKQMVAALTNSSDARNSSSSNNNIAKPSTIMTKIPQQQQLPYQQYENKISGNESKELLLSLQDPSRSCVLKTNLRSRVGLPAASSNPQRPSNGRHLHYLRHQLSDEGRGNISRNIDDFNRVETESRAAEFGSSQDGVYEGDNKAESR
eukprot:jgi/Bigna1/88549/estExt_fgenesh1_pg.C_330145